MNGVPRVIVFAVVERLELPEEQVIVEFEVDTFRHLIQVYRRLR